MSNAASPETLPTPGKPIRFPISFGNNWKQAIQRSGLPEDVQNLIATVVIKSRLLRFEKMEIAAELISHFQDGDDRGQSFPQLMDDFGDPAVTACLVRRSKLRNRPMLMKILKGLGIGTGMLTVAYLAVLAFFHLGQPNPNINYLVDFNGGISDVDDSEKAWLLYRPVWTKYGFSEGGECNFNALFVYDDEGVSQGLAKPTDENWPEAVAELEKYQELLDVFRAGAKLPALGIELKSNPEEYSDENFAALFPGQDKATVSNGWIQDEIASELMRGSVINVLLPHIQSFRKAARAFHVDTRLAVEQGNSERAVENIETVFGLADQAAETPCLVCGLVGMAVAGIGFEQLEEVVAADPDFFSEEQLAQIQAAVERMPIRSWVDFEGERASIKDIIQRCYTDDGNGDGRMTDEGVDLLVTASRWISNNRADSEFGVAAYAARKVMAPTSLFLCASRKEATDKTDELINRSIAEAQIPYWLNEDVDAIQQETDEFFEENKIRHMLLAMMFPASRQVINAMDRTIGRQEGVIAALAIHRHYKKYGQWPSEYDQISPEFVTEFPVDQLDGSLVKFKYDDDELMVYSIGRDYDDDGGADHVSIRYGNPVPEQRSNFIFGPKSKDYDGDWILWPQRVD